VGKSPSTADDELVKLSTLLRDENKRKAFHLNAEETMKQENIDASVIPQGLIDILKDLSVPDLGVVSRANVKLRGRLTDAERKLVVQFPV
jgi:hypothetical protein